MSAGALGCLAPLAIVFQRNPSKQIYLWGACNSIIIYTRIYIYIRQACKTSRSHRIC